MTTLYLARHGETEWNRQGRCQGHCDVPLSDHGRRQAEHLGRRLADLRLDAVWASDLSRAAETAGIVARTSRQRVEVVQAPGFREMDYGDWEGLRFEEIAGRFPEELAAYHATADGAPPGGESPTAVAARARATFDSLWSPHLRRVLLVAHGVVLKALALSLLGADPALRQFLVLENAALAKLRYGQAPPRLLVWNDTCHLDAIRQGRVV
jgi:broad specificity phosphatase PhoE